MQKNKKITLKKAKELVEKINSLDKKFSLMSNLELKKMTPIFKERLEKGETLEDILVEAFATVKEASKRALGMAHYDVQLLGGISLHNGKIAEMKTGEGKTLVATTAVYLNALSGKGVHVITVNDYLAKRDKEIMEKLYSFLGLSTGVILHGQSPLTKKSQYACDITYGTNNEFGFDYLRDNMATNLTEKVQRGLNFAIVDEVDSILIDEARTPLIISAPGRDANKLYLAANTFCSSLTNEDFEIDEKMKTVSLTEQGVEKAEKFFSISNLMDIKSALIQHHINQSLQANFNKKREVDYIVKDNEVIIVDEFTGRVMPGRRYSDGLHQAIEAKEGVKIQKESRTLATITFQNYFRLYNKLAGMTGTAKTEEEEFKSIYNLEVIQIPTNKPIQRVDHPDKVYGTKDFKVDAIVSEIKTRNSIGQPILVGTISIEDSELLSKKLTAQNIKHTVLNAKHHEREASIIAQAGRLNSVTISTNMAGRGTDIIIGGNASILAKDEIKQIYNLSDEELECVHNPSATEERELEIIELYNKQLEIAKKHVQEEYNKVMNAGGLCVIGTERHESRRIDNQLRGRAGRQGDKGESIFFISLQDDLMRIFGGDLLQKLAEKADLGDTPLEHNLLTKKIESAQKKVESRNFSIRKQVVKYDDVLNAQRGAIYNFRNNVLIAEDMNNFIGEIISETVEDLANTLIEKNGKMSKWKTDDIEQQIKEILPIRTNIGLNNLNKLNKTIFKEHLSNVILTELYIKQEQHGKDNLDHSFRLNLLNIIDVMWISHIDTLSNLKDGIHLRSIGQEDPAIAYRNEGITLYDQMTMSIAYNATDMLLSI